MIPFDGVYNRQQWGQGVRWAMHPTGRSLVLRLVGLAIVLAGIAVIGVSLADGEMNKLKLLRLAIGVGILAYWVAIPYVRAWRVAALPWRRPGGAPRLKGFVADDGIHWNESAAAVTGWDAFLRARVRDDMVVLVSVNGVATVLMRDFFADEAEWQSFRQLVAFKVTEPR